MAAKRSGNLSRNRPADIESRVCETRLRKAPRSDRSETARREQLTTKEKLMAHIQLPEGIPGIVGPMAFSPQTAKPMNELADILLRGENTLSPAEREMIATYVSSENDCYFCQHAHGAVAAYRLGGDEKLINDVKTQFESAAISPKLKALLGIAGKVQKGGKSVTSEQVEQDRSQGASV